MTLDKLLPTDLPESFGLLHEYHTPTVMADAMAELAGSDGLVRGPEPGAGINRLIRAFSSRRCLHLEAEGASASSPTIGLVVSNPPYAERGEMARKPGPDSVATPR